MRTHTLLLSLGVSTILLVGSSCSNADEDCFSDRDCFCERGATAFCEGASEDTAGTCRCDSSGTGGTGGTAGMGGTAGSGGTAGTGGTAGSGGTGGSNGCAFTSSELGTGWSGSPGPSCSETTVSAGDVITCSVGVTGAEDVAMALVDPMDFNSAGSGFVVLTGDGLAEVQFDTLAAPPGEYVLFVDMAPDSNFLGTYVALEPNDSGNYIWFDVIDNLFSEPGNDLTCPVIIVTVEEP